MQAFNVVTERRSSTESRSIDESLLDIVTNIKIEPSFCITHPRYQPTRTPEDVVAKLERMLPEVRHKYLTLQLKNYLRGIYCHGNWAKIDFTESQTIENQEKLESSLFAQLNQSNCSQGYLDYGWSVTGEEDGLIALYKDELTLHVEADRYLLPEHQTPQLGDIIPVKCPNNLVEHGYYVAVGNAGTAYTQNPERTVNIYFNFVEPEGAILLTNLLTQQLNAIEVPFTFKCLYVPSEYDRYDAGVLNLDRDRYLEVKPLLDTLYQEQQSHFGREIPLFAKYLAPGVGFAEEAGIKDSPQDNFIEHRCQILAAALIEAWQQGNDSPQERLNLIRQHFSQTNIDLDRPYVLNEQ